MAQLIQMRQRIKAIETIKKITHAMRIISMSLHGRLKSKEIFLSNYRDGLRGLLTALRKAYPIVNPPYDEQPKKLVLLIGSNKGLTGNFNTALFKFFASIPFSKNTDYIAIGKKAIDYLQKNNKDQVASFSDVSFKTIFFITHEIANLITQNEYEQVIVISNISRSFFIQKPQQTRIIPFEPLTDQLADTLDVSEYYWEQKPEEIIQQLTDLLIKADIQYLIFESLLAEQAARFVSMDSSTRNATNLLDETKLQYNKLRQTKITKELTELTGAF